MCDGVLRIVLQNVFFKPGQVFGTAVAPFWIHFCLHSFISVSLDCCVAFLWPASLILNCPPRARQPPRAGPVPSRQPQCSHGWPQFQPARPADLLWGLPHQQVEPGGSTAVAASFRHAGSSPHGLLAVLLGLIRAVDTLHLRARHRVVSRRVAGCQWAAAARPAQHSSRSCRHSAGMAQHLVRV